MWYLPRKCSVPTAVLHRLNPLSHIITKTGYGNRFHQPPPVHWRYQAECQDWARHQLTDTPSDSYIKKEHKKLKKYQGVKEQVEKMWELKTAVLPVLIEVTPKLGQWLQQVSGNTSEISAQKSAVLERAKILCRTLTHRERYTAFNVAMRVRRGPEEWGKKSYRMNRSTRKIQLTK